MSVPDRKPSWRRVTPGRYVLRGTDIKVLNMKGTSVRNMGSFVMPWRVYVGTTEQSTTFWHKADAQRFAEDLARPAQKGGDERA